MTNPTPETIGILLLEVYGLNYEVIRPTEDHFGFLVSKEHKGKLHYIQLWFTYNVLEMPHEQLADVIDIEVKQAISALEEEIKEYVAVFRGGPVDGDVKVFRRLSPDFIVATPKPKNYSIKEENQDVFETPYYRDIYVRAEDIKGETLLGSIYIYSHREDN